MLTAVVSLVVFLAAAFAPGDGEPRWGVFADEATCQAAVEAVRASGAFATDCVRVTLPAPTNGAAAPQKAPRT